MPQACPIAHMLNVMPLRCVLCIFCLLKRLYIEVFYETNDCPPVQVGYIYVNRLVTLDWKITIRFVMQTYPGLIS